MICNYYFKTLCCWYYSHSYKHWAKENQGVRKIEACNLVIWSNHWAIFLWQDCHWYFLSKNVKLFSCTDELCTCEHNFNSISITLLPEAYEDFPGRWVGCSGISHDLDQVFPNLFRIIAHLIVDTFFCGIPICYILS